MSLASRPTFAVESLGLDDIDGGTSILLTSEDTEALEAVFYRLVAAQADERSVLLATDTGGRGVKRNLRRTLSGAEKRATILTCEGPDTGDDVRTVDDLSDLTGLGMQYSTLLAETTQEIDNLRAGLLLCSTIMGEVEDTRSVYRFLNSNFLSELRRSKALGVCAIDMSEDIGADIDSTLAGLETSFNARIHVEPTGDSEATLDISGLSSVDQTVEVSW